MYQGIWGFKLNVECVRGPYPTSIKGHTPLLCLGPRTITMLLSRGYGAHLHWTLLHPEEVFLQHWVGLYLSPDWILHTHPPAQGQGHKSECKRDRTQ